MDEDFEEWMGQMLLDNTRVEVAKMILPQANKKHAQRKAAKAKVKAKMGLHKFIQAAGSKNSIPSLSKIKHYYPGE